LRIEAAACRGKPVLWNLIGPWDLPSPSGATAARTFFAITIVLLCSAGAAFFARRNLRMGRGDRRGATRLAFFFGGLSMISWVFREHHHMTTGEFNRLIIPVLFAIGGAFFTWLFYVGLEPFVRRRWPGSLVSWSRVLAGSFRDPLVGRDLLVGFMLWAVICPMRPLRYALALRIGVPQEPPYAGSSFAPGNSPLCAPGILIQRKYYFSSKRALES
jgi:hypothetical protein